MSAVLPSHYMIPCPFCGVEIKVPAERIGELSICEHCKQEIILERSNWMPSTAPSTATRLASMQTGISDEMIGIGYLLAFLIPLIGFVIGIYFLFKNSFGHGIGCMLVSLISNSLWVWLIISLASL